MSSHEHKFGVPKPIENGEQIEVIIENVNGHAEGIARHENMMIFVKNAHKNEKCKVRVIEVKRSYAIAEKII